MIPRREDLTTHSGLALGDRVTVPGHRKRDPRTEGTLTGLHRLHFARSTGIFAEVTTDDGRVLRTAVGLVSGVRA